MASASVTHVFRGAGHDFSKQAVASITLLEGLGIEGDAHAGVTVKHRSRVRRDPTQPNLRQVHLMASEFLSELVAQGFAVEPGWLGENVTTGGLDLLGLPTGTLLHLGDEAIVEVTGLRNPCRQLDAFRPGLLKASIDVDDDGNPIRKAGVMGIVVRGGVVRPGDAIAVELPAGAPRPLEVV